MTDESRFVDYDAAFAEQEAAAQPLTRKLFGKVWELPGTPPASVVLRLARLMADGRSETDLNDGELLLIAVDLIPGDTLEAWTAKGLDTPQLTLIIEDLMAEYGPQLGVGVKAAADAEGNEVTPETAATPSLPTGGSSKPTSPASTGSFSQVL